MRYIQIVVVIFFVLTALMPGYSQTFTADSNPIFPLYDDSGVKLPVNEGYRYSGSPTVGVTKRVSDGTLTLWVFYACDLPRYNYPDILFAADSTYGVKTENLETWTDIGCVLTEDMFSAANGGWAYATKQLWAPNYKCVDNNGNAQFMLYVPAMDGPINGGGVRRIGIASTTINPANTYTVEPNYFQNIGTESYIPGYAYDPGVFCDQGSDINGDWYMSYCTGGWPEGRIAIAKMADLYSAIPGEDHLVEMHLPNGHPISNDWYMEGPEIHKYYINETVGTMYYLIFAQSINQERETIAYAMATEEAFHRNPWNCWVHMGDIMPSNSNTWINHATIIKFKGHMLFFYHDNFDGEYNTNHQVCATEFEFNPVDGTIPVLYQSDKSPERVDYDMLNIEDQAFYQSTMAKPSISLKNTGNKALNNFKVMYYFTAENGKTPVMQDFSTPNSIPTLKRLEGNQWAIELDFAGVTLEPGDRVPATGGETFILRYTDWSYFDKSNDFSQPKSDQDDVSYKLNILDTDGKVIYGKKLQQSVVNTTSYMNCWSGKMLTVTNEEEYGQNDKFVKSQSLNKAWTSQDWVVKNVSWKKTVRLLNKYTGTYLTVRSQAENATVICQPLNTGWLSQEWFIEKVPGTDKVRFRNAWASNKYLTVETRDEYSSIWSKSLHTDWLSQEWLIQ